MNYTEEHEMEPSRGAYLLSMVRLSVLLIVLCGLIYPLVSTGLANLFMPGQAKGSMIKDASGQIVGSELIGQNFTDPKYFQGRVSSIEYNAEASGTNNYAPSNADMLKRTEDSIKAWQAANPDVPVSKLPVDLITNSGSGLDPHITPESARVQIPRISKLTGLTADELEQLVEKHTEGRDLGLFGESRVNVLRLNLDLREHL